MTHAIQTLALLVCAPFLQGVMRRIRARLQGKPGPSIWQPYRDLRKLFSKDVVVPNASALVLMAPGAVAGVAVTFAAAIPNVVSNEAAAWPFDAVALALLLALGRFVLILAALQTRSAFEGMASGREIAFAALTEAPLILTLLGIAALGDGTVMGSASEPWSGTLLAASLVLVMLSETARIPVDNQETHYELTMIHEGLILEFSGWHLALLQYAAYVRQIAFYVLIALLLPGNAPVTLVWIAGLALLVPFVETTYAKLRLFEVPQLFTSALILALAGTGLRVLEIMR